MICLNGEIISYNGRLTRLCVTLIFLQAFFEDKGCTQICFQLLRLKWDKVKDAHIVHLIIILTYHYSSNKITVLFLVPNVYELLNWVVQRGATSQSLETEPWLLESGVVSHYENT